MLAANPSQTLTSLPPTPNRYHSDPALQALLARYLSPSARTWAEPVLQRMGELSAGVLDELAALADRHPPVLHPRDRFGNRVDHLEFHPAYRQMQELSYGEGLVSHYYDPEVRRLLGEGLEVAKFAHGYLFAQAEQGLYCPVCMTDGAAYLVERYGTEEQKARLLPRLTARRLEELWEGAMFLTEKAGGSDVGATETEARPEGSGIYRLYGEKWFCSNAGAELAMVLARPQGAPAGTRGLALFALRRHDDQGRLNGLRLERLKDKLGTRSMPTGEILLEGARAELLGDPRRGFVQMTDMLNLSRLYNAAAAVALVRRVTWEALRWSRHRRAFGQVLESYPGVRQALAALLAELEGALHLLFLAASRRGRLLAGRASSSDQRLLRLLTPLLKYSTARLAVWAASEATEILGGNGYIEDWPLARFYRDAQVLPIWEGTTNILVLDALRAVVKEQAHEACFELLEKVAVEPRLKAAAAELEAALPGVLAELSGPGPVRARAWCDRAVQVLQAALLASGAGDERSRAVAEHYFLRHFAGDGSSLDPAPARHAVESYTSLVGEQ